MSRGVTTKGKNRRKQCIDVNTFTVCVGLNDDLSLLELMVFVVNNRKFRSAKISNLIATLKLLIICTATCSDGIYSIPGCQYPTLPVWWWIIQWYPLALRPFAGFAEISAAEDKPSVTAESIKYKDQFWNILLRCLFIQLCSQHAEWGSEEKQLFNTKLVWGVGITLHSAEIFCCEQWNLRSALGAWKSTNHMLGLFLIHWKKP
jgi:hypothetical protein